MPTAPLPVVMVFAGLDPTGGAGLAADIEAIASMGAQAAPVATALTVQDSRHVVRFESVAAELILEQARAVLADLPVAAFKIGVIGSIANAHALQTLLAAYPEVPVVLDPVLAGGGGGTLAEGEMAAAVRELLLPLTTVATPNSEEARQLAPEASDLDGCARALLASGCELLLITGAHEQTAAVENRLYGNQRLLETFSWERLPFSYHGSGCTLASAIAGLLAQGLEPFTAIHEAQEYTFESLRHAHRPGMGQHLPNRFFWARGDEEEG